MVIVFPKFAFCRKMFFQKSAYKICGLKPFHLCKNICAKLIFKHSTLHVYVSSLQLSVDKLQRFAPTPSSTYLLTHNSVTK